MVVVAASAVIALAIRWCGYMSLFLALYTSVLLFPLVLARLPLFKPYFENAPVEVRVGVYLGIFSIWYLLVFLVGAAIGDAMDFFSLFD